MTWKGRYSPEPLNKGADFRDEIDARFSTLIQSQSLLGAMVPRSVPHDAVVRPFVTELPVAPGDGDEIRYLADSDDGIVWHLRYRASAPSDYRWEFLGGSALLSEGSTVTGITATSYTSTGPTLVLPLAGDYDVTIGGRPGNNTAGATTAASYAIGSTAASDNDWIISGQPAGDNGASWNSTRTRRKTGLGAVQLTYQHKVSAGTGFIGEPWMSATPIRVGRTT